MYGIFFFSTWTLIFDVLSILQELVSQSKFLKVTLEECRMLAMVLRNCEEWKHEANSLLQDIDHLFNASDIGDGLSNCLVSKIEQLVDRINTIITAGFSLGYDFCEITRLQSARSTLIWCNKVLSLCHTIPSYQVELKVCRTTRTMLYLFIFDTEHFYVSRGKECWIGPAIHLAEKTMILWQDVESLLGIEEDNSCLYTSGVMWSLLMEGVKWLKRALEVIPVTCNSKRRKLSDAEELLSSFEVPSFSFSPTYKM